MTTSTPMLRAVPRTERIAASSVEAVQIGHLDLGDLFDLLLR